MSPAKKTKKAAKKPAPKGTPKGAAKPAAKTAAKKARPEKKKAKKKATPPVAVEEESPEAAYTPPAFAEPAEPKPRDDQIRALEEFFVSPDEMDAAGAMSLDLYRDEMDTRLRAEGVQEYLSFVLADESYAVNIFHIKEIIKLPMITEVPRTEPVICVAAWAWRPPSKPVNQGF